VIAVEFKNITKAYHHKTVLKDLCFSIEENTFEVIFGEPGCGKSVIMRVLTGIEKPNDGRVFIREKDVTNIPSGERNIGYIPQSFALYPHYSVYDNIAYPLKFMKVHKKEIDRAIHETAELLRISPLLRKAPDQLSGGEKQRIALARGIIKKTDIFVFDDPLAGLDFKLREQLIDDLKQMQQSMKVTFVYATSDPLETLMLAKKVCVISSGEIIEKGPLEEAYEKPDRIQTMELLGFPKANILSGFLLTRDNHTWCKTKLFDFPVILDTKEYSLEENKNVIVACRPEKIKFGSNQVTDFVVFKARIILREDLGGELIIHLDTDEGKLLSVVRHDDIYLLNKDDVLINIPYSSMLLFSKNSGKRVGQGGIVSHA